MNDKLILKKLKELIDDGNELGSYLRIYDEKYSRSSNNDYNKPGRKWKGAAFNLLNLRFGRNSDYYLDFHNAINKVYKGGEEFFKENVDKATGVLEFVYDALKDGFTDDLFYKHEILVFSDLLEQAFEFLKNKLQIAAGIYGRIVLETTIREYAKKHAIENVEKTKFDQLIIKLRTNNVIQKPFENSLRANYGIGSWAAHGKQEFQDLPDNQIKEFLTFIRDKVLTLE